MGNKFTIKKSKIRKRPKKRGKYKPKPKDPNKPRTVDELDAVFPGHKEHTRLARGIVEEDEADPDNDDTEDDKKEICLPSKLIDVIPENWGKLMTSNKLIQEQFEDRLNKERTKFSKGDQSKNMDPKTKEALEDLWMDTTDGKAMQHDLADRLQKIQDKDPEFLKHLSYLVGPIVSLGDNLNGKLDEKRTKVEQSINPYL